MERGLESFARGIVASVDEPLLVLDGACRVLVANDPFFVAFGSTPADTEGRLLFDVAGGRLNQDGLRRSLEQLARSGETFEGLTLMVELPVVGPRHLRIAGRQIQRDATGTPVIVLAFVDDTVATQSIRTLRSENADLGAIVASRTAELARANQQLVHAVRELSASNRELEAFCYSVSHDLRGPLRAVDGFSLALLDGYAEHVDERGRHYLNRIRAGTQRMGQLIEDLLNLSRVTRAELRFESVNLTALADEVMAELREREPDRAVRFTIMPDLWVTGDAPLLRVAIENLLANAWKFTARRAVAEISLSRVATDGAVAFVVRDNGAGFEMAYVDKLFGAFQRLHHARDYPGAGIGLATVQRILRRHGGAVWAEGVVDHGAAFFFSLPNHGVSDASQDHSPR